MQAGLTPRRLDVQKDFPLDDAFWVLRNVTFVFFDSALLVNVETTPRLPMAP